MLFRSQEIWREDWPAPRLLASAAQTAGLRLAVTRHVAGGGKGRRADPPASGVLIVAAGHAGIGRRIGHAELERPDGLASPRSLGEQEANGQNCKASHVIHPSKAELRPNRS